MRQDKIATNSTFHLSDGLFQSVNINGAYADYVHDEKDPNGTVLSTFRNREWNARGERLLGAFRPFSASAVGVHYGDRRFSGLGEAVISFRRREPRPPHGLGREPSGGNHQTLCVTTKGR